jgi:hypothetical protein
MRQMTVFVGLLGALVAMQAPVQAREQAEPYCLKADAGTGCAFRTMQQCMQAKQGEGGYCYAKPAPAPTGE